MDELLWLEWVRAELARRRLPKEYCRRLLIELADHLHAFTEDRSMDAIDHKTVCARLGEPSAIAESARAEFHKMRFALRHPLVTFTLGPVLCLLLFNAAELLVIWGFLESMQWLVGDNWAEGDFAWFDPALPTAVYLLAVVPIAASAALFCRLAFRSDCAAPLAGRGLPGHRRAVGGLFLRRRHAWPRQPGGLARKPDLRSQPGTECRQAHGHLRRRAQSPSEPAAMGADRHAAFDRRVGSLSRRSPESAAGRGLTPDG